MRYLLDTNICSHFHRGTGAIAARLGELPEGAEFYLSVVVEGELLYGINHAAPIARARLVQAVGMVLRRAADVLPVTRAVADRYGRLKAELAIRGSLIPSNDIWVAATALEAGLILVTDDAHFDRVQGLTVENWLR